MMDPTMPGRRHGRFLTVILAAAGILWLLLVGRALATGTELPVPGWDLVRSLSWPGALVAAAFSPVGRSVAALLDRIVARPRLPVPPAPTVRDREQEQMLRELAEAVKRSTELQAQIADAMIAIQQSLAILLDRTPRAKGVGG